MKPQRRSMDIIVSSRPPAQPQAKPRPIKPLPKSPAGPRIIDVAPPRPKPLPHMAPMTFRPYRPPVDETGKPDKPAVLPPVSQSATPVVPSSAIPVLPAVTSPPVPLPVAADPVIRPPTPMPKPVASARLTQARRWQYALIGGVALFAMFLFNVPLANALVLAYLVASIVLPIESKWSFIIALGLLVSQPLLLAFKQTGPAENYAVYSFYFLCIGLLLAIVEYKRDNHASKSKHGHQEKS